MVKTKGPDSVEIVEMQSFYDDKHSLRDTQKRFGWSRGVLIKHLKTRQPKNISDEERRKRAVNKVVNWRQRAKQKLVAYKGGRCETCGYNKCIDNLTFHHLDPSKKISLFLVQPLHMRNCKRK